MCNIPPTTPPIGGGGPVQQGDPTQAKGSTPTTPPAPTQLPGQTTAATTGAVAGAAGGGETAPAATAVAGASNLAALAPVLQQLLDVLNKLVAALQGTVGGGHVPPIKGDGIGTIPISGSEAAPRRGG